MGIKFTDLHVNTLAKGLLDPGEQLVDRAIASRQPWWSLKIPLFKRTWLLLATNQRLIIIEHRRGLVDDRMDKVDSLPWTSIEQTKLSGMGFSKKISVKAAQRGIAFTGKVDGGFLAAHKGNINGAKAIVSTWQGAKALPAARA
jgi:Bacterial PH domain